MGGPEASEGLNFAKKILDHILPVAEHIDDNAAVVLFAVIPRGALKLFVFASKNPIAKLTAHGEDFSEESSVDQVF